MCVRRGWEWSLSGLWKHICYVTLLSPRYLKLIYYPDGYDGGAWMIEFLMTPATSIWWAMNYQVDVSICENSVIYVKIPSYK